MAAFGRPPNMAKNETTKLDILNRGLRPPTIHSKEGNYKTGYTEWRPSTARRTLQKWKIQSWIYPMVAFGCQPRTAKKESTNLDILNGGLRPPTIHSKDNINLGILNGRLRPPTVNSKEGSYKPGYPEWWPSAARCTQRRRQIQTWMC